MHVPESSALARTYGPFPAPSPSTGQCPAASRRRHGGTGPLCRRPATARGLQRSPLSRHAGARRLGCGGVRWPTRRCEPAATGEGDHGRRRASVQASGGYWRAGAIGRQPGSLDQRRWWRHESIRWSDPAPPRRCRGGRATSPQRCWRIDQPEGRGHDDVPDRPGWCHRSALCAAPNHPRRRRVAVQRPARAMPG